VPMQDMIKQIVDMDRQAREVTEAAKQEKLQSEQDITKRCEELRLYYLEKARHRIAVNEPKERAAAEELWKEKEQHLLFLLEQMNVTYQKKADEWVRDLTARIIAH